MDILAQVEQKIEEINKVRREALTLLRNDFAPMFKPFFDRKEDLQSFSWNQFTPYFSDGDDLIFEVNRDVERLSFNGKPMEEIDELQEDVWTEITEENFKDHIEFSESHRNKVRKIGERGYVKNKKINREFLSLTKEISHVLHAIPDDFFKDLFGDHVEVTVHRDGTITTSKFDHD